MSISGFEFFENPTPVETKHYAGEDVPVPRLRAVIDLYRRIKAARAAGTLTPEDAHRFWRMLQNDINRRGYFKRVPIPGNDSLEIRFQRAGRIVRVPMPSANATRTIPNHLGWPCRKWDPDWQWAIVRDAAALRNRSVMRRWETDTMRKRFPQRETRVEEM